MSGLFPGLHHKAAREWTETRLDAAKLIYPVFVTDKAEDVPIEGFERNIQWGEGKSKNYESLISHLRELSAIGLRSVMLFGVVKEKDPTASEANKPSTPVIIVTKLLRVQLPELMVMLDVCMCEYTDHGHCGWLRSIETEKEELIDKENSTDFLAEIALSYAKAGAHWVCPSDMLDGRVKKIRQVLDRNGFYHVGILSYTSKKASAMYGPFRAAVDSTFKGDRKRYQQPIGSTKHALQAMRRDIAEGASAMIVKPALFYGDIIKTLSERSDLPIISYIVSGDYVMILDYSKRTGDLAGIINETHCSMIRAGSDAIISYFTPHILKMLQNLSVSLS